MLYLVNKIAVNNLGRTGGLPNMLNGMPNNNPYAKYKQTEMATSTPDRLLIMLFEGGIRFLTRAQSSLQNKDYEAANKWLLKVQDILSELIVTLDMEQGGQIATNLFELYDFYRSELIVANLKKEPERLQPVLEFFHLFHDTWVEASKKARMVI
jgi:flagellar protein FliS